jgi:phage gp46-like protein
MARGALGLVLALTLTGTSAHADFAVKNAAPRLEGRVLHLETRFDLNLNPKTEEALHKGIPLDLVVDFQLLRKRWWWTDRVITDLQLRRRLQFHALSRQYMVVEPRPSGLAESFASLDQALAYLGDFSELRIPLTAKKEVLPDTHYVVAARAYLNIEALPALMRPLAYATPSWYLGTGWTEWPVQP